jgi:hypothetical protein
MLIGDDLFIILFIISLILFYYNLYYTFIIYNDLNYFNYSYQIRIGYYQNNVISINCNFHRIMVYQST